MINFLKFTKAFFLLVSEVQTTKSPALLYKIIILFGINRGRMDDFKCEAVLHQSICNPRRSPFEQIRVYYAKQFSKS